MTIELDCSECGNTFEVQTPPQDLHIQTGPTGGAVIAGGRLLTMAVCEKCKAPHVVRVGVHVLKSDAHYPAGPRIPDGAGPLAKLGGLFDAMLNKDDNELARYAYESIHKDEGKEAADYEYGQQSDDYVRDETPGSPTFGLMVTKAEARARMPDDDQGDDDDPPEYDETELEQLGAAELTDDRQAAKELLRSIRRRRRIMKHLGPEGHDVLMPDDDDDDRDPKRKPN